MLQSGLDISPGHHAPVPLHRVRGGLRRSRRPGDVRQGDPRLDGRSDVRQHLARHRGAELDEIRPTGLLQGRARDRHRRRARACGSPTAARCSTSARTTTSASPTIPRWSRRRHEALDRWGYGMASVRFICGTQTLHKELEEALSAFLGTEDTILYSSCFDANGGLFETLLGAEDAIISDELNHASIIDGIRLCKAQRLRYANSDMADLEAKLTRPARRAPPPDRHRRRLLDGRLRRAARRDLRPRRAPRRAGDGRRLARGRLHRRRAGAARPSCAA